jgi:inosine-uridine nucleoside N-ribohydrolase
MQNNKSTTPLWLDLELREDIDDYITLVFALENNCNIKEVSIHNPSINELKLLKNTLNIYKKNTAIIVSGAITHYEEDKDIHKSLLSKATLDSDNFYCSLEDYFNHKEIENRTFFCGGSLYTLSECLNNYNPEIFNIYIQGGFAGKDIVGEENTLKKFKKRTEVPTWNLNLDIEATDNVLKNTVNMNFISKNICHASFIGLEDINQEKTLFNEVLVNYFGESKRKKCMHDLLAFLTIFNDEIVQFKNIDLKRTHDEIPKWHSVINENSNKKISTSFNYDLFLQEIKNHKEKPNHRIKNKL